MNTMSSYDPIDEALNTHTEVEAIVPSKKDVKLEKKLKMKLRMNQLILKTLMEICMLK